jgi:hypothetical protein
MAVSSTALQMRRVIQLKVAFESKEFGLKKNE